ncbi:glycosyltransferase family 2 protein [Photobacterium kishitanii]|uniref:glycosyltransferase family 2 protein n=1 Tax=Photobacterium kishitanii TaxID=318456 RepID=UPI002738EC41|nr:glycosyltransferase family 2 protein [Photobacterium kishitanii]
MFLENIKKLDPRIKIVYREKNGHISENSNSALEVATGEFIALMDHDDLLSKNALYEVVKVINDKENVDLIYSDEDKITHDGIRYDPHFKSDFNLDLIYSQNYISHLGVYKTDIVKNLGGFRKGFEGSQDYDLLLRYLNVINHGNIYHISKVLYHWRAIEGSTALNSEQKSYTTESGIKALDDYLNVLNIPALVEKGIENNTYKINWPLDTTKKVSIIIPTYNGYTITKQAIDSILKKTSYPNYEIIIVNNNSDDKKTLDYLKNIQENKIVRVIDYPFEFNYSAINNYAVKESSGDIIALLNNDVEVINKDWLSEMVSLASRSEIGCVGAKLYYPNNTIQHAGVICGIGGVAGHSHKHFDKSDSGYFSRLNLRQNLLAVTAACLVVRKDVFNKVNGLNEKDLKIAFNDVDFCLKVHSAGYLNVWTPYAELYHHESISRGFEDSPEKIERFNREIEYMRNTWSELLDNDKYYNNNLTKDHENFQIKLN